MLEVLKYVFWGGLVWAGIAVTGQLSYFLYLKIKTRQEILDRLDKMRSVLEESINECEKARRVYQALIDAERETRENMAGPVSKKLH